jgi:catechol 2,3-dioxygenase-like lactoylglutathione lyase family enzyme
MFDHIGFRVSDLRASRRFYASVGPAGRRQQRHLVIRSTEERIPFVWIGTEKPTFWTGAHNVSNSPIHMAFSARSKADVDAFHKTALQAGGSDNGKPGPRGPQEMHYYAAYVLDPDGNNIEAGFRGPA